MNSINRPKIRDKIYARDNQLKFGLNPVHANQDHGTVNATQHNHYGQIANLQVLVEQFKELIDSLNIGEEEKQDTKEILDCLTS